MKKQTTINLRPNESVIVKVSDHSLLRMLSDRFYPLRNDQAHGVYIFALAHLPGRTVEEVVKLANKEYKRLGGEKITVRGFKNWLPEMLSEFFKEAIEGK